ncbi:MAG: efflux RND transporter periplasmic adaptor subunit [Rhodobiaceae bacterium]|nr:efflux RND transporter periplasmic adaptor subunit [Rhodobiaceae bacterium]
MPPTTHKRPYTLRIRMKSAVQATLIAGLALSLAACGEEDAAQSDAEVAPVAAVSVFSTQVLNEELTKPITGTGTMTAHKGTDVGPLIDGIIEEVFVRVGDRVAEGDPLFKTRDVEFRLRVQELEAQHRLAEAESRNSRRELDRIKELHGKGVASVGQLDNVQTKADIATARLNVARARLDAAKQNLKDATVYSPFDGVITSQQIYEGKFMSTRGGGGGMGGPSGVLRVLKIDIVAAIINVPEVHVGQLSVGMKARIYVDGLDGVYDSEIHVFNDQVDQTTRSAEVRIGLRNPEYLIKPGMFARAEFFPPPREALTLNRKAVLGIEGSHYVFIEDAAGRAKQMPVRVSQIDAERVELLEGLTEGAEVLMGPTVSSLVEGMPVRIENSTSDGQPSAALAPALTTTGVQ